MDATGRFVAFASSSPNLVPHDANGASDVFLHDRQTGGPTMTVSHPVAGQTATISISGGSPGGVLIYGVSLTGQGILPTPAGPLELAMPVALFVRALDAQGASNDSVSVPLSLSGLPLWVQGVDLTLWFPTEVWAGSIQ